MRFRFPRIRRRGGTMPAHKPDGDSVMATLSEGKHAQHWPDGRIHCTTCSTTTHHPIPAAKAPDWLIAHRCDPNRHHYTLGTLIADTDDWIRRKGYTWEPAGMDPLDGLRLTRDGHPDVIAPLDSTLVWDGERITVEQT